MVDAERPCVTARSFARGGGAERPGQACPGFRLALTWRRAARREASVRRSDAIHHGRGYRRPAPPRPRLERGDPRAYRSQSSRRRSGPSRRCESSAQLGRAMTLACSTPAPSERDDRPRARGGAARLLHLPRRRARPDASATPVQRRTSAICVTRFRARIARHTVRPVRTLLQRLQRGRCSASRRARETSGRRSGASRLPLRCGFVVARAAAKAPRAVRNRGIGSLAPPRRPRRRLSGRAASQRARSRRHVASHGLARARRGAKRRGPASRFRTMCGALLPCRRKHRVRLRRPARSRRPPPQVCRDAAGAAAIQIDPVDDRTG